MFFSASTGGFYDPEIHRDLPEDAVRISRARHAELLDARSAGMRIVADRAGRPLARSVKHTLGQLRARAVSAVKAEARRRILMIASVEQQANDNAAIALEALRRSTDASDALTLALDRRARIDAIRAGCNAIEAQIARMPAANLTAFDPSNHPHWPRETN